MSDFACIGLRIADEHDLDEVVREALPRAVPLGTARGVEVRRWEDPHSGARVIFILQGGEFRGVLPSLASDPGARFGRVEVVSGDVWGAALLDEDGEQVAVATFAIEEGFLLDGRPHPGGVAPLVSLGAGLAVHDDEAAFERSPDSLLDPRAGADPAAARLASRSFISFGALGPAEDASAYARLAGVVVHAERRVNSLSGGAFHVARVVTAGFETDVCIPEVARRGTPGVGRVVSGDVLLVASLPVEPAGGRSGRRRWWRGH
jgi:hypothetical protein